MMLVESRARRVFTAICTKLSAPQWREESLSTSPPKPTAWLHGLRGLSALIVYITHYEQYTHPGEQRMETAWGHDKLHPFAALPMIRTFITGGHVAVMLFFVMSGYVLSIKPLSLIHAQDLTALHRSLSSALFRRWLRLYLPVIIMTFFMWTTWWIFDLRPDLRAPSFAAELVRWLRHFAAFSNPLDIQKFDQYHPHAWSMSTEFRGSLIVFGTLLGLSQCRSTVRLACTSGMAWYFLVIVEHHYAALFTSGILLCELDMLSRTGNLPKPLLRLRVQSRWPYVLLLLVGIYLAGYPALEQNAQNLYYAFGWGWLSLTVLIGNPQFWFGTWSAIFIVAALPRVSWAKAFCESSPLQYIGRISYFFYLVHGPILWTLSDRLYVAIGRFSAGTQTPVPEWWGTAFPHISAIGPLGLEVNVLIPHLIIFPVTVIAAEYATRYIDEPVVRLTQKVFRWTLDDSEARPTTGAATVKRHEDA